jgi:hypothetical protein
VGRSLTHPSSLLLPHTPARLAAENSLQVRAAKQQQRIRSPSPPARSGGEHAGPSHRLLEEEEKKGEEEEDVAGAAPCAPHPGRRLLTAGPLGGVDLTLRGLHVGTMRRAQLAADAVAHGDAPPTGMDMGFRLSGPPMATAYLRDVGAYGDNPRERPTGEADSAGFVQTTRVLSQGTTRTSRHPPGYTGHVPSIPVGAAAEQGLGAHKRNTFHAQNNLSETVFTRVPGYGGHQPSYMLTATSVVVKPRGAEAESDVDRGMGHIESWYASLPPRQA